VRTYGVASHELVSDLFRESGIQAAINVDFGQFFMLALVVRPEFGDLAFDVGMFGVGLRMHRNVLSRSHRHRASDQTGDPRDQDVAAYPMRGRDAQHEARCGKDAVICPQYRRTQPSCALRTVLFSKSGFAHFGVRWPFG
jgi:hypothetical protein